ncbi:Retron-type reverse transcriptase [bacterium]|nr:Retron-type reverse transcriptase [bacterium]MBU1918687.1 Retron-type reverse transcriptase [bacterium]
MRTFKNIFNEIISFQNLLKAAKLAQRAKRFKTATARFNFLLENELWKIQNELKNKSYEPGAYYNFKIYEPKERIISAAPYKDRVVHHAIHNILEPIFEPTFIFDSYATRKEKGSHAAINQFQRSSRKTQFTLKCDIKKYFQNIHHGFLMKLIDKKIKCHDTTGLIEKILGSYHNYSTNLASLTHSLTHSLT